MDCLFPNEETCPDPEVSSASTPNLQCSDSESLFHLHHQTHPAETFERDCCCEKNVGRGEVKSCNPLLAKTTHKAMNRLDCCQCHQKKSTIVFQAGGQQHDGSLLSSNHWNRWRHCQRLSQCVSCSTLTSQYTWLCSLFITLFGIPSLLNLYHFLPPGLLVTWTPTFSPSSSSFDQ